MKTDGSKFGNMRNYFRSVICLDSSVIRITGKQWAPVPGRAAPPAPDGPPGGPPVGPSAPCLPPAASAPEEEQSGGKTSKGNTPTLRRAQKEGGKRSKIEPLFFLCRNIILVHPEIQQLAPLTKPTARFLG